MQWPEITELNNITITPMYPGSRKSGGLKFAASQPAAALGHHRFGRPESIVQILPLSDVEACGAKVIEEPTIYGGLLFTHFGHALAESIHRLWPKFALEVLQHAKVAFSPVKGAKIMPYVTEALNLHGISERQAFRIRKPLCFRRLFVGPQARQMGGRTLIEGYQAMLDKSLELRLPPPRRERRLYISRFDWPWSHGGSFYGESEVSRQLASEGFEIIYPERHSLTELVTLLRDSRLAVFAEGSAIHALELCGSNVPDVLMISRRPNSSKRFKRLLANICSRCMISDHLLFSAGLSENPKKHWAVVDLPAVMRDIQSFTGGALKGEWTSAWAMQAINDDLERLINRGPDKLFFSARDVLEDATPPVGNESRECYDGPAAELRVAIRKRLEAVS